MEKTTLNRQELYELVWSQSLLKISRTFNITYQDLKKVCKKMDIPLPENGYWQKIQYNKPLERKKLPEDYTGPNEINLPECYENKTHSETTRIKSILLANESIDQKIFRVLLKLNNPDKLIIAAQKSLLSQESSEWWHWLVHTHFGEITIKVAPASVNRALCFMDTIIKVLRYKGYDLVVIGGVTYAVIESENIEIALREKLRIEKTIDRNGWKTYKYYPTGKLIFRFDCSYRAKKFMDGEKSLEEKLPLIITEIEYRGQKEKEQRIESEIRRKEAEERLRIENERKARKDKEIQDFKDLLKESKSWHQSVILDNFIQELERRAIENSSLTEELQIWINWAKQKADWFNPFIKKEDEFLDENDRFIF